MWIRRLKLSPRHLPSPITMSFALRGYTGNIGKTQPIPHMKRNETLQARRVGGEGGPGGVGGVIHHRHACRLTKQLNNNDSQNNNNNNNNLVQLHSSENWRDTTEDQYYFVFVHCARKREEKKKTTNSDRQNKLYQCGVSLFVCAVVLSRLAYLLFLQPHPNASCFSSSLFPL